MADAYKTLYRGQLAASVATIYTAPAGTGVIIKHMAFLNQDSVARTFQLFRNGTTAAFAFTPVMSLRAGELLEWDGTMALLATDTIAAVASAASVMNGQIDGDETS